MTDQINDDRKELTALLRRVRALRDRYNSAAFLLEDVLAGDDLSKFANAIGCATLTAAKASDDAVGLSDDLNAFLTARNAEEEATP